LAAITTPAAPAWGSVATREWMLLGWWTGLSLLAMVGLFLAFLFRRRAKRRGESPVAARVLAAWAGVLFVAYAGYHAQAFVRDVLTW
jgi:threonine/homoserine/homoserine lactone efflux protein